MFEGLPIFLFVFLSHFFGLQIVDNKEKLRDGKIQYISSKNVLVNLFFCTPGYNDIK
jgi:hypothetical protein